MKIDHPIDPVFHRDPQILILGSFPSVKSREDGFFYGHPQNRFWRVLAAVFHTEVPVTVQQKRELLRSRRIALWDVIASCQITGSADSAIRDVVPNDLSEMLSKADIRSIYVNGKVALRYYERYIQPSLGVAATYLPSTSAANAGWSLERLIAAWQVLAEDR